MINKGRDLNAILETIRSRLEENNVPQAVHLLMELHPADRAEVFNRLSDEAQEQLLPHLDVPATADLLEELEDADVLEVIESMDMDRLADVLDEMEPDEAADLLGDLAPDQAFRALEQMEDADEVIPLLGYPDESAGGLMTTSYIALRPHTRAEQAIEFLRQVSPDADIPYYLFVVDRDRRLIGVVGLRDLIIAPPDTWMESIMDPEVIYVTTETDQEEAARVMARYDLTALPVVNEAGVLQGVITHDDIVDVMKDEATEDILHMGGVETGPISDKPYWSQRIIDVARSRFFWLLILFVAETLTVTVLRSFERQIKALVALSFFIPLLIGTGGNAGSQTVATVIRALALQEVKPADYLRVWWREFRTALMLGALVGAVAFLWAWYLGNDIKLAGVVGVTVWIICGWANSVAALIPLGAMAIGIDPTIVSGPMLATLIDSTGLLIYFSLATWMFSVF